MRELREEIALRDSSWSFEEELFLKKIERTALVKFSMLLWNSILLFINNQSVDTIYAQVVGWRSWFFVCWVLSISISQIRCFLWGSGKWEGRFLEIVRHQIVANIQREGIRISLVGGRKKEKRSRNFQG